MHFDCRYLELLTACIFILVYIVLNVRYVIESKYPSIVFPSIFISGLDRFLDLFSVASDLILLKLSGYKNMLD